MPQGEAQAKVKTPGPSQSICKSCLLSLRHQRLASTAQSAAAVHQEALPAEDDTPSPTPSPQPSAQPDYRIEAAVILSRPPTLTRDLTPFEKAYFLYQRRLNERLALPFTRYFYYQRDSPEDVDWKRKIKERQTPARDIGVYNAYSKEGWNDELLLGARESEPEEQIEALVRDAQVEKKDDKEGIKKRDVFDKPMQRITDADKIGYMKSLNRALTRTLYLVVKSGKDGGRWGFPSSALVGKESLHTVCAENGHEMQVILLTQFVVGSRAHLSSVIRPKHEYVGNRQRSNRPSDHCPPSRWTRS